MRAHRCHATKCNVPVPPEMFMCKRHWFSLPQAMRNLIWTTYRRGQCDDMKPSVDYCRAAKLAVTYIAQREGIEPDTHLYDLLITRNAHDGPQGTETDDA
jgi:hypothetical protein